MWSRHLSHSGSSLTNGRVREVPHVEVLTVILPREKTTERAAMDMKGPLRIVIVKRKGAIAVVGKLFPPPPDIRCRERCLTASFGS